MQVQAKQASKLGRTEEILELPAWVISGESPDGNAQQVYDIGFSPLDHKVRAEDKAILEQVQAALAGVKKVDPPAEGGSKPAEGEKKAETTTVQTGTEATTEVDAATAADAQANTEGDTASAAEG